MSSTKTFLIRCVGALLIAGMPQIPALAQASAASNQVSRDAGLPPITAVSTGQTAGGVSLAGLCQTSDRLKDIRLVDTQTAVPRSVARRELLPRFQRLPGGRPIDLLLVSDANANLSMTDYRVFTLTPSATNGVAKVFYANYGNNLLATMADNANDFSDDPEAARRPKVMLTFALPKLPTELSALLSLDNWFKKVDVYVIGCSTQPGNAINSLSYMSTTVTNQVFCRGLAAALLLLVYALAALAVSSIQAAKIGTLWNANHKPYIGFFGHLDPVVMSASDNG